MCKNPIRIKNNSKYISQGYGQPYYIWINCGHCNECLRAKQQEWNLRTFYEFINTIENHGTIYFDTLTYDDEHLPRIYKYVDTDKNFPCFDYRDIREFIEKLRHQFYRKIETNIKYFITSEYGDIRKRPHYHILLFINCEIDPIELSKNVAKAWNKGRTDGKPYKSTNYVMTHNIITKINLDAIRYVAKYVTKSCSFMATINKRWDDLENYYKLMGKDKLYIKKMKRRYYSATTPFHRQSQGYGIKAMEFFKIEDLIQGEPIFYKDDTQKININITLPTYYKRKLFQKQIIYNGKRIWINNDLGVMAKQQQHHQLIIKVYDRLNDYNFSKGNKYSNEQIMRTAKYIVDERGRTKGEDDYLPHHEEAQYYNYNTDKDLLYTGKKCISNEFAGNDKTGYCTTNIKPINEDKLEIQIKSDLEAIIEDLIKSDTNDHLPLLKEHMSEIRKIFFS